MRHLLICLLLVLAACGGGQAPAVPTLDAIDPTQPPETTAPTDVPADAAAVVLPTPTEPLPIRESVSRDSDVQYAFVSVESSVEWAVEPGELYVLDGGTADARRITVDPATESSPVWGPDGNRLYFVSDRDGAPQIFWTDVTGTLEPLRVSSVSAGDEREPSLSPGGDFLAFTSSRNGNDDIFAMDTFEGRALLQLTEHPARDYQPSWSPDNSWIAFTSERDGNPEIYIMDSAGETIKRLTEHPGVDALPSFSPDGRRIAFVSDRSGASQIHILSVPQVEGAFGEDVSASAPDINSAFIEPIVLDLIAPIPDPLPVTNIPGDKTHLAFARHTSRIAYTIETDSGTRAFVTNEDGTGTELVAPLGFNLSQPVLRPPLFRG